MQTTWTLALGFLLFLILLLNISLYDGCVIRSYLGVINFAKNVLLQIKDDAEPFYCSSAPQGRKTDTRPVEEKSAVGWSIGFAFVDGIANFVVYYFYVLSLCNILDTP
jgi:hypothetical protein